MTPFTLTPQRILMVRSHSMGIGDVLRSSAAWMSLKQRWPQAELHLLFLSRHKGYPTETLIQHHHALASAQFLTIKTAHPGDPKAKAVPWRELKPALREVAQRVQPDLIIDFEPSGLRTTWVTRELKRWSHAQTVGIAQFPGRGWFYDWAAPSVKHFQAARGLSHPMDYTERDYVALAALGIERKGQPVCLNVHEKGLQVLNRMNWHRSGDLPWIGLNIGCGTPDALYKRPDLNILRDGLMRLHAHHPFRLLLVGAPFEKEINQAMMRQLIEAGFDPNHLVDASGTQDLLELAAVIDQVDVFVSSDSGPYHMAVALDKPTLLWLVKWEPSSIHQGERLRHAQQPDPASFTQLVTELLSLTKLPILNR